MAATVEIADLYEYSSQVHFTDVCVCEGADEFQGGDFRAMPPLQQPLVRVMELYTGPYLKQEVCTPPRSEALYSYVWQRQAYIFYLFVGELTMTSLTSKLVAQETAKL